MATGRRTPVVFVVDDDESVLRSLGRLIRAEGFDARLYESSERFLEEVEASPTACLILDLTMPHPGGFNLKHELDRRGIQMPVIILTARDDDGTRREAKLAGAKFFFRKPVDERTLIDAIEWALDPGPEEASG